MCSCMIANVCIWVFVGFMLQLRFHANAYIEYVCGFLSFWCSLHFLHLFFLVYGPQKLSTYCFSAFNMLLQHKSFIYMDFYKWISVQCCCFCVCSKKMSFSRTWTMTREGGKIVFVTYKLWHHCVSWEILKRLKHLQ